MVPEQLVSLCQKRKKGRNGRKREEEKRKELGALPHALYNN